MLATLIGKLIYGFAKVVHEVASGWQLKMELSARGCGINNDQGTSQSRHLSIRHWVRRNHHEYVEVSVEVAAVFHDWTHDGQQVSFAPGEPPCLMP
jgi:hypothetical protein